MRNLADGRTVHHITTEGSVGATAIGLAARLGDGSLVVKRDGAAAWIEATPGEAGPDSSRYALRAIDRTGSRVLAAGGDIDPASLALAGSTLYWTQGSKPFSAALN